MKINIEVDNQGTRLGNTVSVWQILALKIISVMVIRNLNWEGVAELAGVGVEVIKSRLERLLNGEMIVPSAFANAEKFLTDLGIEEFYITHLPKELPPVWLPSSMLKELQPSQAIVITKAQYDRMLNEADTLREELRLAEGKLTGRLYVSRNEYNYLAGQNEQLRQDLLAAREEVIVADEAFPGTEPGSFGPKTITLGPNDMVIKTTHYDALVRQVVRSAHDHASSSETTADDSVIETDEVRPHRYEKFITEVLTLNVCLTDDPGVQAMIRHVVQVLDKYHDLDDSSIEHM